RPDEAATRAETIVKLSRAMGTIPVPESIHATLNGYALYSDLAVSHWAFYYIMKASILLPPENGLTLAEDEYEGFVSAE
ncbi:MAG: hypothetical protein FWC95_05740, partial [Defluviitaleaceae bacterium]|nr:hypothetical protein [Defluviitaleaceae bacterium]